jgi:hypothetical protein
MVEPAVPDVFLLIAERARRLLYYVVDPRGLFLVTRLATPGLFSILQRYISANPLRASLRIPLIQVYNILSSLSYLLLFGNTTFCNFLTQGTIGW